MDNGTWEMCATTTTITTTTTTTTIAVAVAVAVAYGVRGIRIFLFSLQQRHVTRDTRHATSDTDNEATLGEAIHNNELEERNNKR